MVGDTAADIHAGINAKFGEVVGVLSGGGTAASLRAADRLLERADQMRAVELSPTF